MKLISTLTASVFLFTAPALAQEHHEHDHEHGEVHDHQSHEHDGEMTAEEHEVDAVAGRTVTVKVNGMVCDFCARSLTKVLKKKDAVEDVAISLKDKTVTIVLKDGAAMSDDEIGEAVTSAGYNLASIERA